MIKLFGTARWWSPGHLDLTLLGLSFLRTWLCDRAPELSSIRSNEICQRSSFLLLAARKSGLPKARQTAGKSVGRDGLDRPAMTKYITNRK